MADAVSVSDCGKTEFCESFPVPRETIHRLENYAKLLIETNAKFNLIADSTLPQLWTRHFLDCAQLTTHIPSKIGTIVDMGSGAGLPGVILAILCPQTEIHLIESTGKKAEFLKAVAKELATNITVHHQRVEDMRNFQADIVTARALKALPDLLSYAKPMMHKDSFCLFLKGQQADAELTLACKYWTFALERHQSLSDPSGALLKISNLRILRARKH